MNWLWVFITIAIFVGAVFLGFLFEFVAEKMDHSPRPYLWGLGLFVPMVMFMALLVGSVA